MPTMTLTVTTEVANRLADAVVFEQPNLVGATAGEKAEAVRQVIIRQLKAWCLTAERRQAEIQMYQSLNNSLPEIT